MDGMAATNISIESQRVPLRLISSIVCGAEAEAHEYC